MTTEVLEVQPIGRVQRQLVLGETERYLVRAEEWLQRSFARPPVHFDLSGTTAGMFKVQDGVCRIRYNPWIFGKYFQENLRGTVPHEVAHYIVHAVYGRRRVKPHGKEWRAVMEAFGADDGVTFKLDLSGIPQRRQRTHRYHCGCQEHQVSSTRHNRVLRGQGTYLCRHCDGRLVYLG